MVATLWSRGQARLKALWAHRDDRVDGASLAVMRIGLGALLAFNALKILHSEIDLWMLDGEMRMTYYGFSWVSPWPGHAGPALHLMSLALVATLFALGVAHRVTSVLLFFLFANLFLVEKSLYLNHFYLVSLMCGLFIFLPADRRFALGKKPDRDPTVPRLAIWVLRLQLFIVYFYAGWVKINADWLQGAPVDLWFAERAHNVFFGELLLLPGMAVVVSWAGMLFDLAAPVLLLTRFRVYAFVAALGFHVFNHFAWHIGIFPFFMIVATTLFFDPAWPLRLPGVDRWVEPVSSGQSTPRPIPRLWVALAVAYCLWQLLFPFRFLLYPGNVHWTEQGSDFAWRMKLYEKRGFALFIVEDKATGTRQTFDPQNHLSHWQVWKMPEDPEMALQFAHHLRDKAKAEGRDVAVYVHMFVSLNGRERQMYIVPTRDLAQVERSLWPKDWIIPLVTPLRDATPSDFSGLEEPP